jgi:hypothetical protein
VHVLREQRVRMSPSNVRISPTLLAAMRACLSVVGAVLLCALVVAVAVSVSLLYLYS